MSPKSPSKSPPPDSLPNQSTSQQSNRSRPGPRPTRTDFNLEPNPFEQSFRSSSNVRNSSPGRETHRPSSSSNDESQSQANPNHEPERPNSRHSRSSDDPNNRSQSPSRPVLPPLASISSPADTSYPWAYNSNSVNSLRAGPLSPAMLTAPQQNNDQPQHLPFDPATFRTGLTPRIGLTPHTGLTPGTGLTPLVGGPFPTSPNTAAFMALMGNSGGTANPGPTITPNTLSALTGVLNSSNTQNSYPPSQHQDQNNPAYLASASNAASTAANGLFLLSQAHQELTKREEAQARAGGNPNGVNGSIVQQNGKRSTASTKRKSYDNASPSPTSTTAQNQLPIKGGKRTRANTGARRKGSERGTSEGPEDDGDMDDMDDIELDEAENPPPPSRKGPKKPETEEEKRRNFLERNRQAALKCRQRKKAWLSQLQAKVEYLSNENERLTSALVSSREEISRLSALVGGAGVVGSVPMGVGVNGVGVSGPGVQPVSMNVSLPHKSGGPPVASVGPAAGGRSGSGYGY